MNWKILAVVLLVFGFLTVLAVFYGLSHLGDP